MQPDEVRVLFAYDSWATKRVFGTLHGLGTGLRLVWQMLVHVVNHATQHCAEASALCTADVYLWRDLPESSTPRNGPSSRKGRLSSGDAQQGVRA